MYEAIVAVRNSTLEPTRRVIAEEYAYYATPETHEASASIRYIADCTNVCERTVRAVTKEFCESGFLEKVGVNKEFGNVIYRVHYDALPKREPYKYNLRGRPPKVYDGSVEKTPAPDAPVYSHAPAPDAGVANKTPANLAYIEDSGAEAEEDSEGDNYVISAGFEKQNPDTQPEIVSPLSVSGFDVVNQMSNRVMSTTYVEQVVEDPALVFAHQFPDVEQDIAVLLPPVATYPVKVKVKPAKAAAKPKAVKPPKAPKPSRELNAKELAFLAKIEQLNPPIAPDVEQRLNEYSRSLPWSVAQVFLLTGYMPRPNNWHAIISLNGVAFDEKRMVDCYNEWTERGFNERGLAWLLDWYKAGGPPTQHGQKVTQQPASAPSKPELALEDERVVDFANWIYDQPAYKGKGLYPIKLAAWAALNGKYTQQMSNVEELLAVYQAERKGQEYATQA